MQIRTHEMSPFPTVTSIPTRRLTLTKAEHNTLERAVEILSRMREAHDADADHADDDCGCSFNYDLSCAEAFLSEFLSSENPLKPYGWNL